MHSGPTAVNSYYAIRTFISRRADLITLRQSLIQNYDFLESLHIFLKNQFLKITYLYTIHVYAKGRLLELEVFFQALTNIVTSNLGVFILNLRRVVHAAQVVCQMMSLPCYSYNPEPVLLEDHCPPQKPLTGGLPLQ